MIILKFYKSEDFSELNYTLNETQASFTSLAELALKRIEERSDSLAFPITIFYDEKPVGFFVLDFGTDKLELTENPKSVLLRSLSINPNFQGKGIGVKSMKLIPDFLKVEFPEQKTEEIVLAVNSKNILAYNIYLKVGYKDNGKTRPFRKTELQHILSLEIY